MPQASGALPVVFDYAYNAANQRQRRGNGDGSYWIYAYDALGQVASGRRYWPDGTPVAGQQFNYAHDDIGNRTGGDSSGGGLRHANYTANRLNQSTQRDVPGFVDILGLANPTAPVTVNGNPASRKGEYFHYPLAIGNGSSPQYTSVSVVSTYGATQTSQGGVYLPKTPEAMAYDSDGNLTGDGRFNYTWDGENRVTRFKRVTGAPTASLVRVDLDYDSQSRRIQKIVSTNNGSLWIGVSTNRYLYDGWNLVAVVDHLNNLVQTFTWGSDLSGSQQGAGGVGGLLSMTVASGTLAGTYFYAHDGNGNVLAAVNAADGSLAARYDYGPFGEPIRASGPLAQANPFQFSTKFNDPETGLLYYGYRYYDPITGRWPNRDPIGEAGGINLYGFVRNNPVIYFDHLGLQARKPRIGEPGYVTPLPPRPPDWRTGGPWKDDGRATIVCDGKGGIRIQYPKGYDPAKADPCVAECLDKHELCHKQEALASNPSICAGQPDGTQVTAPDDVINRSEVRCSQVELDCLKERKGDCSCSDSAINNRIPQVEAYRDKYKTLLGN